MDKELEVIRHQMEQTRSSLADKIEALENEVRGTVEGATSAVTNTVESVQQTVSTVKEGVQETVETVKESVKETFNVRKHVERHPWAMFSGAVMAGCFAGMLVSRARRTRAATPAPAAAEPPREVRHGHRNAHGNGASRKAAKAAASTEEGGPLQSSLKTLKSLAIGTLMGALRDVIVKAVPSNVASELAGVVDDMTTRLGGKTLRRSEETDESGTGEGGTHDVGSDAAEMGRPMGTTRWSR